MFDAENTTEVLVTCEGYRRIIKNVRTIHNVPGGFVVETRDGYRANFTNEFHWKFYFGIG